MFTKSFKTIDDFDGIYQYLFDTLFDEYYELCSPGHILLGKSKEESKEEFLSIVAHQAVYYLLRNLINDNGTLYQIFSNIVSTNSFFNDLTIEKRC